MNISKIDLNLLVLFHVLIKERSLSKAADKLNMSQPAASNALNRLRNQLGDPLFVRAGRGLSPTPKALTLIEPIAKGLQILEEGIAPEIDFEPLTSQRTFNICFSDYGDLLLMPDLLSLLSVEAPSIKIKSHNFRENSIDRLHDGSIDLLYSQLNFDDNKIKRETIFNESILVIVSANHSTIKKEITMENYLRFPHVISSDANVTRIDSELKKRGFERKIVAEVSGYLPAFPIVAADEFISTPPARLVEKYASNFNLKYFKPPFTPMSIPVHQYWSKSFDNDLGLNWLRTLVKTICLNFSKT